MKRNTTSALALSVLVTTLLLVVAPLLAQNPPSDSFWTTPPEYANHGDETPLNGLWPPPPPLRKKPALGEPHRNPGSHDNYREPVEMETFDYNVPDLAVGKMPDAQVRHRYESVEVWRDENSVILRQDDMVALVNQRQRPIAKPVEHFPSKGEWMEHQLIADYPRHPLVNDTFVMIKTGSQTQWKRMPFHVWTTLPRVHHFALYSDKPGSIAGYEIIDILRDVPDDVKRHKQFARYRMAQQMSNEHWNWDPAELNSGGGWDLDKYKNLPMLHHAYMQMPDAKWYFFIDDDTYVFWDNLYSLLEKYNSTQPVYLGSPAWIKGTKFPFAHGGSGVVLSNGAMTGMFNKTKEENKAFLDYWARAATHECCGDFIVAKALNETNVYLDKLGFDDYKVWGGPFHGSSLHSYMIIPGMLSTRPITLHHIETQQAEILYEYERARGKQLNITVADLYRDFVLPYITTERHGWRMQRWDKEYKIKSIPKDSQIQNPEDDSYAKFHDDGKPLWPYKSKENCSRACELDRDCLMWSYGLDVCYHGVKSLTIGAADNKYHIQNKEKSWVTGWMIDRIRHHRALDKSDPLQYNEDTKEWNDTDMTSEGWYFRVLGSGDYKPADASVRSF